jgi:hypothetical protein
MSGQHQGVIKKINLYLNIIYMCVIYVKRGFALLNITRRYI